MSPLHHPLSFVHVLVSTFHSTFLLIRSYVYYVVRFLFGPRPFRISFVVHFILFVSPFVPFLTFTFVNRSTFCRFVDSLFLPFLFTFHVLISLLIHSTVYFRSLRSFLCSSRYRFSFRSVRLFTFTFLYILFSFLFTVPFVVDSFLVSTFR